MRVTWNTKGTFILQSLDVDRQENRAAALPRGALKLACDPSSERAAEAAKQHEGCRTAASSSEVFTDQNIDAVIVSTPHATLAELTLKAVEAGKHVLVEKPGGITSASLRQIQAVARPNRITGTSRI